MSDWGTLGVLDDGDFPNTTPVIFRIWKRSISLLQPSFHWRALQAFSHLPLWTVRTFLAHVEMNSIGMSRR